MKLLLLNAPPIKRMGVIGQTYPSLGLMYLAAYAREQYAPEKFEVKILDGYQEKYDDVMDQLDGFSPDVLGVSFSS